MVELLILYLLFTEKNTTYGIKKLAEEKFSPFFKFSFGTIHPALKRLLERGLLTMRKEITSGGQRKSFYSVTQKGKQEFESMLLEELPDNPQLAEQLICIKVMALSSINSELKTKVINKILKYLELSIFDIKSCLNNEYIVFDEIQKTWMQLQISIYEEKIGYLSKLQRG